MSRKKTRTFVCLDKPSLKSASGCLSVEGKILNYEVFCQRLNNLIFIDNCTKSFEHSRVFHIFCTGNALRTKEEHSYLRI